MTGPDSEGLQAEATTKNESPGPYSIGSDNWPGLAKLAEECGEVIQVIGKLIAMGGAENYDHWDGTHLRDRVLVLNVGGYIGESTRSEIEYATAHGKPISYLEDVS